MHLVIIQCFDCNGATFAIEAERNEWEYREQHDDYVTMFACPYCQNQIWEKQSNVVGIIKAVAEGEGRNVKGLYEV